MFSLAPFVHALRRFYRARIGAFRGGMTQILVEPIVEQIKKLGGTVVTNAKVTRLIVEKNRMKCVEVNDKTDYPCDYLVMAASLNPAHQIIRASSLDYAFPELLSLPFMPEVNLQIEFARPAWPVDRTVFGVGTSLITFSEQSRTTFTNKPGRLSIILTPPERILDLRD